MLKDNLFIFCTVKSTQTDMFAVVMLYQAKLLFPCLSQHRSALLQSSMLNTTAMRDGQGTPASQAECAQTDTAGRNAV